MRCLHSVLRAIGTDTELIVVDNASSSATADRIEAEFPRATLVRSPSNLGFGAGCNLGARRASGGYLVFLNPDTHVESGWIEALIDPLERDPRAGLSTAKILLSDAPDRINTCGNAVHITGLTLCRGFGAPRSALGDPEEVPAVSGAAFAIRRELFHTLGGFDEDTFLYMEDTDLSLRARLAGWGCLYAPSSIVFHDYSLRITPRKVFYQERNRYLMLLKCLRWPTLFILLPALLLAEVLTWGFSLWSDRANLGNKLSAYGWVIRHWLQILRKRRAVQALRRSSDRALLVASGSSLDFSQAGRGLVPRAARLVFNPAFFVLRTLVLILVWW